MENYENPFLDLQSIQRRVIESGIEEVMLKTDSGVITTRYHPVISRLEGETAKEDPQIGKDTSGVGAVVWVGGAGGGLEGPAGGLYPRLAGQLTFKDIASLRIDYRFPNIYSDCVQDVLTGITFLEKENFERIVLVGHSFGGAVVITVGALHESVAGVIALSSQTAGTELVPEVSPRPVLFVHGTADRVLPDTCSKDLFARAYQPKDIILYKGCSHGLDECRNTLDRDLLDWIRRVLLAPKQ